MTTEKDFQQILSDLKHPRDWRVREEAIKVLADFNNQPAMEAILSALYDESPHVVRRATFVLRHFGHNAIDGLLEALYSPKLRTARSFIIGALDDIDDPDLVPHYIHFLDDADYAMHYASAHALSKRADDRALQPLLEALQRDNSAKADIIDALGRIDDPEVIPAIKSFLTNDEYIICRHVAIVLGNFATNEAIDALIDATTQDNSDIKRASIEGLGIINSDETYEYLTKLINTNDVGVRSSVIGALGKSERAEAVPILVAELNQNDQRTMPAIRVALGDSGQLNAVQPLLQLYRTDDRQDGRGLIGFSRKYWEVDQDIGNALSNILASFQSNDISLKICGLWLFHSVSFNYADPSENTLVDFQIDHIRDFAKLLISDDMDLRLSAMISLSRRSLEYLEDEIIARLHDQDKLIARMSATALADLDTPKSVQALSLATQSPIDQLRYRAINSLSTLGGKRLTNIFQSLLDHPDNWTRRLASSGLGRIQSVESIPRLIEKFHSEKVQLVKASIVWALGDIGHSDVIPTLIEVLESEDEPIPHESTFDNALYAIGKINNETVLPILNKVINEGSSWQRRMRAVEAISRVGSEHQVADRLFDLLPHENDTVRTTASKELGYLGARTSDLDLRDYIVNNLKDRLDDKGVGYHFSPTVATMAAKSLYYVGTSEAIKILNEWKKTNEE